MALALGEWDVNGMMDGMSATLMDEWKAFFDLEPFGAFQDEYRAGLITSVIANTARDEKEHPKPFQAEEFMRKEFTDEIVHEKPNVVKKLSAVFSSLGSKKLPGIE